MTNKNYINREEVLNIINFENEWLFDAKSHNADTKIAFSTIKSKIAEMPYITLSRTRGKWIHWTDDYKDYVTCSCCEYGEEGEVLLSDKTPFCPICGADMRESGGEQ